MWHARALFARKYETIRTSRWLEREVLLHMHVSFYLSTMDGVEQLTRGAFFYFVMTICTPHVHDCCLIVQATIQCLDMPQALCET